MMRLHRPRTVLGLVLIGFSIVALPLLLGIARAAYRVDQLAEHSQHLVVHGVQVTRVHERLAEHITDMERYVRQYYVVGDPTLWGLYLENKVTFTEALQVLRRMDGEHSLARQLLELMQLNDGIDDSIPLRDSSATLVAHDAPESIVEHFTNLRALAINISERSTSYLDVEIETLGYEAARAQHELFWQSIALLPLTIGLVALFSAMIVRPIRDLASAITKLGEQGFSSTIAINGPDELRALGARLDWLRIRLRETDETKNTFLRHISHELKTPLASLREGTELLSDGSVGTLSVAQKEVADILHENCLKLQTLIENLLNFSAWQHETRELKISRFDFRSLVNFVVAQHRLEIRRKELEVTITSAPVTLCADRRKFRTAIDNLISNAVKFSPQRGQITIAIRAMAESGCVDIVDQGPGVSPGDREFVFEPFYQGQPLAGSTVRGTGIGLSVVRECARARRSN
ncbi:MAG: two-component system sensor histidine kinase GlrK [Gammaproteobacteria bacterium]|jgi:two-component system sensor histidine kinase GlrK